MKVTFKKRRYYKGKFREVGETLDVHYRYARAFLQVGAVVPAITQVKPKSKPKKETGAQLLKRTQPVKTKEIIADAVTRVQEQVENIEVEEVDTVEEFEPKFDAEEKIENPNNEDEQLIEELSYWKLRNKCKEKGLSVQGSAVELIGRLKEGE